jgi:hypothetical protein
VRLANGQRHEAIADLCRSGEFAGQAQMNNTNLNSWRSALALALAPEHPQEAREIAQENLEMARCINIPRAIGIALRVCGSVTGGHDGIELLEHSVAVLEPTPMRLELAHSLTELGAALRRAGACVAAREPLRRTLDLAHRCGATPLAQRARDEALAAGARPRRPSITGVQALTPSEPASPASPPRPSATARSPKHCSSPPKPSAPTSPAPTTNSTSTTHTLADSYP